MKRIVLLIVSACLAEVLGMAAFATFPSLLPTFKGLWGLTNAEAGWINGIYFAGYTLAVPVLVSLTDRVDTRRVYLPCMALSGVAALGFVFAEGFWSALALRALAGVGLAGTYMPGLKALSDLIEGPAQSRAVAFYTASFGIGASVSFLLSGEVAAWLDWRWAFGLAAAGPVLAMILFFAVFPPRPPLPRPEGARARLIDFMPVLRNRPAMGYVAAYTAHNFELFGLRTWVVAFLAYSETLQGGATVPWSPTLLAAVLTLAGNPASILGNEMALRVGRRRWVVLVQCTSAALACVVGFTASLHYAAVAVILIVYGMTLMGESAPTTAGTLFEADPAYRGTTMGVHSFIGFSGSFLGPLVFGYVLDATGGGATPASWGIAFATMGLGVALGPVALLILSGAARRAAADG